MFYWYHNTNQIQVLLQHVAVVTRDKYVDVSALDAMCG